MNSAATQALLRQALTRGRLSSLGYDVARTRAVSLMAIQPTCAQAGRPPLHTAPSPRLFHTSPPAHKKKKEDTEKKPGRGKSADKPARSNSSAADASADIDDGPKHPVPSPEEPLDFADVESRLSKNAEYSRMNLKKLQTGGRFDPDLIGALRVAVDKDGDEVYPLRELAQVVPRGGRAVSLLVHEAAYVKPIMSAVQASPEYNQQPQKDPDNELELILKVEVEKREDLIKRIKAVVHEWRSRIRAVRQKRDKLHTAWRKDKLIGPDLKRTAEKELEKVIKAALLEVDEAEKSAIKIAEST